MDFGAMMKTKVHFLAVISFCNLAFGQKIDSETMERLERTGDLFRLEEIVQKDSVMDQIRAAEILAKIGNGSCVATIVETAKANQWDRVGGIQQRARQKDLNKALINALEKITLERFEGSYDPESPAISAYLKKIERAYALDKIDGSK